MVGASAPLTVVEDGVVVTRRAVGDVVLEELVCPPGHRFASWEPERPYVALVLEGAMQKTFRVGLRDLGPGSAITIPISAAHATHFGSSPTRIVKINPVPVGSDGPSIEAFLNDLAVASEDGLARLAWRLATELHARDAAADLALEGLSLEALASVARRTAAGRPPRNVPPWLRAARDLIHESADIPTLGSVAREVGVHSSHLARSFRATYGLSVGEYARRLRFERAMAMLASTEAPLALVAAKAGYVDQSHFTREFKRRTGSTPARYRAGRRS